MTHTDPPAMHPHRAPCPAISEPRAPLSLEALRELWRNLLRDRRWP